MSGEIDGGGSGRGGVSGEGIDRDRVESRAAHLLPEERAAGSDDPQAQAAAILSESDRRTADPTAAPDSFLERRASEQAVPPQEPAD